MEWERGGIVALKNRMGYCLRYQTPGHDISGFVITMVYPLSNNFVFSCGMLSALVSKPHVFFNIRDYAVTVTVTVPLLRTT